MQHKFDTAYLYSIDFEGKSIYIGTTNNLNKRAREHNLNMRKIYDGYGQDFVCNYQLYSFLVFENVNEIKLSVIKEFENIPILKDVMSCTFHNSSNRDNIITFQFEHKRYEEEELEIKNNFRNGNKLFNLRWPCKYDTNGKIRTIEESKIPSKFIRT